MRTFLKMSSVLVLFFARAAHSTEEFETVVKDIQFNSSSRIVIDKEEIEKSHARSLTTLLAAQANISIAQSNFSPPSIFIRGGDSSHILILIDGVPSYDASSPQRTLNLNAIDIKSVKRIEVVKGSQSVLYGGQALTGVIKIETIPRDLKSSGYAVAQTGSFQQSAVGAGVDLALEEKTMLYGRAGYDQKNAPSPMIDSKQNYSSRFNSGEAGYVNRANRVNSFIKVQTSLENSFIPSTDYATWLPVDADNNRTSTQKLNLTGSASIPSMAIQPTLSISSQKSQRLYEQDYYASAGQPTKFEYVADLTVVRYDMTAFDDGKKFKVIAGASYTQEKLNYRSLNSLVADQLEEYEGVFVKAQSQVADPVLLEAGYRQDFSKMHSKVDTFQIGATFYENLKFEYATGFKRPSLFQYISSYGNPNLESEKSKSYSGSYDYTLSNDLFISYIYFVNQFENLIVPRGTPLKYTNIQSSITRGHELSLSYQDQNHGRSYNLSLGYQEPVDNELGTWLDRQPLRTASMKIRQDLDKVGLGAELIHVGSRRNKMGYASYGTLVSYTLLNLIADYSVNKQWLLFSRVQNVGNQRYESSYGYYDEGLNAQIGAEYSFN